MAEKTGRYDSSGNGAFVVKRIAQAVKHATQEMRPHCPPSAGSWCHHCKPGMNSFDGAQRHEQCAVLAESNDLGAAHALAVRSMMHTSPTDAAGPVDSMRRPMTSVTLP